MSEVPNHTILFGAGASFSSGSVIPRSPPMTIELSNALVRLFPMVWGALPQHQRSLLKEDFEAGMKEIGEKTPYALPALQRTMASFFFGFVPGEDNLYRDLARHIRNNSWTGALVTLNYERLLELSLIAEGVSPYIGSTPNAGLSVELCLPHGCCHIFCDSIRGSAKHILFSGRNIITSGQIAVVANASQHAHRIKHDAFPPVMSYFDPAKLTTSGVNFIKAQRARYEELVNNTKVIAIIGLRVRPNDKHLWEPIASTDAEVIYCSGHNAGLEFENWASKRRVGKNNKVLDCYFREAFNELFTAVGLNV